MIERREHFDQAKQGVLAKNRFNLWLVLKKFYSDQKELVHVLTKGPRFPYFCY
jgi:hypothetical protein